MEMVCILLIIVYYSNNFIVCQSCRCQLFVITFWTSQGLQRWQETWKWSLYFVLIVYLLRVLELLKSKIIIFNYNLCYYSFRIFCEDLIKNQVSLFYVILKNTCLTKYNLKIKNFSLEIQSEIKFAPETVVPRNIFQFSNLQLTTLPVVTS